MMSKLVLFVCLVLGTVYANTQISLVNAKIDSSGSIAPVLVANLNDFLNVSTIQPTQLYGTVTANIPATDYLTLPSYAFVVGEPLTFSVVNRENALQAPFTAEVSLENVTLVENQSYSFVFIAPSDDSLGAYVDIPTTLLAFEERPNPSPFGKASLRVVNIAVSTFDSDPMVVNVTGTGVAAQLVSVPFGAASEFIEYDSAVALTLEFTLPLDGGGLNNRSLSVTTVVNSTVVVYIRGDIGGENQLGSLSRTIDFAFPAAPTPVAPPTAEPVSEPMADTPAAPAAAPTTVPAARTPTKRVSSAAQTVAQVAGVAALVSLLF